MRIATETFLLFKRRLFEILREPIWLVTDLLTPLLYIALFAPLLKNLNNPPLSTAEVLNSFVPGILTILSFNAGIGAGWTIINELQSGVIERFRVTPASRFSILLGQILMDIVYFVVPGILVLLISSFFGFRTSLVGLAVHFLLLSLLTGVGSAWSGSLGLILKKTGTLAAVVMGLNLPLTLLSGMLLPISLGPNWLQMLARLNPLYYTVEASRMLSTGNIFCSEVLVAFAVMVPLFGVTILWAASVYKKAVA